MLRFNKLLRIALRRVFAMSMFVCLALFYLLGNLLGSPVTHAASQPTNPPVVIAIDITSYVRQCSEIFKANIDTSHESTTQTPCSAGTIIGRETILRSQAIAMHDHYVLLPSSQLSPAVQRKEWQQIQHLMQAKGESLLDQRIKKLSHPLTRCGASGSASLTWGDGEGDSFYSTIAFYKSSDCTTVDFTTATIKTLKSIGQGVFWDYDLYGGQQYNVPGCPVIDSGTHSHGVGQSFAAGYYYENWIAAGGNFWCPVEPDSNFDNIGPIN